MHESPAVVTRVPRISRPLAVFRRRAALFEQPFSFCEHRSLEESSIGNVNITKVLINGELLLEPSAPGNRLLELLLAANDAHSSHREAVP